MSERPHLRLFTLCALYAAQGIPWGFVYITLKAWLAGAGLSVESIGGLMALAGLPWVFKPLWGPVLDAVGPTAFGRRRPWIVAAQFGMIATLGAMIAIPDLETNVVVLGWMVFTHNVFNSLQDVSVDALAVDLLSETERGRANGLMYGSKYGGGFIGGAGMAAVAGLIGLKGALGVQVGMLAVIMLLPLFIIERPGDRRFPWDPRGAPVARPAPALAGFARGLDTAKSVLRAFRIRSAFIGGIFAILVHAPAGVLAAVGAVFYVQELGWSKELYATVEGGPVLMAGLIACILGGFLGDRFGRRRTIAAGVIVAAGLAVGFSFAESMWSSKWFVTTYMVLDSAAVGLVSVGLFALFMDISWPKVAATQFTTYMALLNLSSTAGQKLAGKVDDLLSYPQIFLCAGLFQLLVVGLIVFIDPRQTRRELSDPAAVNRHNRSMANSSTLDMAMETDG
jgi:PAT family beta-lactamase induction signal transducer AmpG